MASNAAPLQISVLIDQVSPPKIPNNLMTIRTSLLAITIGTSFFANDLLAQTLPVTTGLHLWLKADAGVTTNGTGLITGWADQSGQGNNAAPTNNNTSFSPTLLLNSANGLPTVRFPGGTKYLDVQDSPS